MATIILKTLKPENIKKGVTILKTTGTYEGGSSGPVNMDITVDSSTVEQEFTAGSGYTGLGTVTVNPYVLDSKTVDASTVTQVISSSENGLSSVTVNAVDASIDPNIVPGNIKSGASILGVEGTLVAGDWLLQAKNGWTHIETDTDGLCNMSYGMNNDLFAHSDVETWTFTNTTITGDHAFYRTFAGTPLEEITFANLTTIDASNALNEMCYYCTSCNAVYFPKLTTVRGYQAMANMNERAGGMKISGAYTFPELVYVNGCEAMCNVLIDSASLTSVSFPKLEHVEGQYTLQGMLASTNVTTISMPRLLYLKGDDEALRWFAINVYNQSITTTPEFFKRNTGSYYDTDVNLIDITIVIPSDYTYLGGWNNTQGTTYLYFGDGVVSYMSGDNATAIMEQLASVSDYAQVQYTVQFGQLDLSDYNEDAFWDAVDVLEAAGWTVAWS